MSYKTTIALDLSTYMGFAVRYSGGAVESGTKAFKKGPTDPEHLRYWQFQQWLNGLILSVKPQAIYYESVQFGQKGLGAVEAHYGWLTVIKLACIAHSLPLHGFNVSTIKLTASGHGKSGKERMIAAARNHFPDQIIQDDNQADALCVLYTGELWAAGKLNREPKATKKARRSRKTKSQPTLFDQ